MRINLKQKNTLFVVLITVLCLLPINSWAQINGSLFMLPNNFYAQMYNPAFMRNDKTVEITLAGPAGVSFINHGNFKIADLITTPFGSPVIDPVYFYGKINRKNYIRQDFTLPVGYFSFPIKKGVLKGYYKENINSVLKFNNEIVEYLINGNTEPEYKDFSTGNVKFLAAGYREFAIGYAKQMNKKINAGIHAKLLIGAAYLDADNWNFTAETANDGSYINFRAHGTGYMMLPLHVRLRTDSTIFSIESEKAVSKYLKASHNPGMAIDLGINYRLNKKSNISASVRDLGLIWYRTNAMKLTEEQKYGFIGFDLVHAVRFNEEPGYVNPLYLIDLVKDSVRNVWHPKVLKSWFTAALATKTVLHYQYRHSENYSFGVTNQSVLQWHNFHNILTFSALQSWSGLSVFENISFHGISDFTFGGGFQYEAGFIQAFLATDNLIAFYHPANNKTFSITAGICFLFNHRKILTPENINKGMKKRNGKISPELPFYKQLRELRK